MSASDDSGSRLSTRADSRNHFGTALRLLVAVGLTLFILWRAHPSDVLSSLAQASWPPIVVACLLVVADRALMGYRWIALLAHLGNRRPPLAVLVRVFFVSTFVGTFLPQSVGSDAVRVWSLTRRGVPASESLASVLMDRLLGIVSILLSAGVGLAIAPAVLRQEFVVAAFVVTSACCVLALAFVFSVRLDDLLRRALDRWGPERPRGALVRFLDALQAYRDERRMLVVVLAASILVQGLRILQAWWLGQSLGIAVPLEGYVAFIPVILLVMLLPITINGLGVGNSVFVWAFAQLGVTPAKAFALSMLFIALGVVGNLPGGVLYVMDRKHGTTTDNRN